MIGKLTQLEEINLSHLDMTGTIDYDFVEELPNLRYLNLANNKLMGDLPNIDDWRNMRELRMLELQNNSFTGRIPQIWP